MTLLVSKTASARTAILVGVTAEAAAFIEGDLKLLMNVTIRGVTYDGLFNLSSDVTETTDISGQYADDKARMVAKVGEHRARSEAGDIRNDMAAAAAYAAQNDGYWGPWLPDTDASTHSTATIDQGHSTRTTALTTRGTRCGEGVRPVCSDGKRPSKCDDGSTGLPCSGDARPLCDDESYPLCPATGSSTSFDSTAIPNPSTTVSPTATLAPPASRTECPSEPPYFNVVVSTTAQGQPQVVTSSCPPYIKGWNNPADAYGQLTTFTIPKPVFAAQPIPVGKELTKYGGIMYLVDDGTALGGSLGVMKNGVEVFGRQQRFCGRCRG